MQKKKKERSLQKPHFSWFYIQQKEKKTVLSLLLQLAVCLFVCILGSGYVASTRHLRISRNRVCSFLRNPLGERLRFVHLTPATKLKSSLPPPPGHPAGEPSSVTHLRSRKTDRPASFSNDQGWRDTERSTDFCECCESKSWPME